MYVRDHKNCWNCNGWWWVDWVPGRKPRWKRAGMRTLNMICLVCGHNYDLDDEEESSQKNQGV